MSEYDILDLEAGIVPQEFASLDKEAGIGSNSFKDISEEMRVTLKKVGIGLSPFDELDKEANAYSGFPTEPIDLIAEENKAIKQAQEKRGTFEGKVQEHLDFINAMSPYKRAEFVKWTRVSNVFNLFPFLSKHGVLKKFGLEDEEGDLNAMMAAVDQYEENLKLTDPEKWANITGDVLKTMLEFKAIPGKADTVLKTAGKFALQNFAQLPSRDETLGEKLVSAGEAGATGLVVGAAGKVFPMARSPLVRAARLPFTVGGFMGLTALHGGNIQQILESGITILGFEAAGLGQKGLMEEAIKKAREFNPELARESNETIKKVIEDTTSVLKEKILSEPPDITKAEKDLLLQSGMTINEILYGEPEALRARLRGETTPGDMRTMYPEVFAEENKPAEPITTKPIALDTTIPLENMPPSNLPPQPPLPGTPLLPSEQPPLPSGKKENFVEEMMRKAEERLVNPPSPSPVKDISEAMAVKLKEYTEKSTESIESIKAQKHQTLVEKMEEMQKFVDDEIAKGTPSLEATLKGMKFLEGPEYKEQLWDSIEDDFSKEDINKMYLQIDNKGELEPFEKLNTKLALADLMKGHYLVPSQVALITDTFPELGKEAHRRLATKYKAIEVFTGILGIPMSLKSSADISVLGRQLAPLLSRHPGHIPAMEKLELNLFFRGKEYADAFLQVMKEDPRMAKYRKLGLEVTKPSGIAGMLTEQEERFPSKYTGKIPLVARSERAFVFGADAMRIAAIDEAVNAGIEAGKPLNESEIRRMTTLVNDLSGRSSLPKGLPGQISHLLSTFFWSPRFVIARSKAPLHMLSQDKTVQMNAIKAFTNFAGFVATTLTLAQIAKASGNKKIDSEFNPLSTNFGKITTGNLHIDVTGGYASIIRTVARMATGLTETQAGEILPTSRSEELMRFLRTKTAPLPQFASKLATGEDWLGRKAFQYPTGSVGGAMTKLGIPRPAQIVLSEIYDLLMPMPIDDFLTAWNNDNLTVGLIAAPLTFHGFGTSSYIPMKSVNLTILKNEISQQRFGKNFRDITPQQQKRIELLKDVTDLKRKADYEKDITGQTSSQYIQEAIDSGRRIRKALDVGIQTELDALQIPDFGASRNIGGGTLNDTRYEKYEEVTAQEINKSLNKLMASTFYQKRDSRGKILLINNASDGARTRARNKYLSALAHGKE